MPNAKMSHEQMRRMVCGICWLKPKGLRDISATMVVQLQDYVYPSYSLGKEDCWLPKVICDTCRRSLRNKVCFSYLMYKCLYIIYPSR